MFPNDPYKGIIPAGGLKLDEDGTFVQRHIKNL